MPLTLAEIRTKTRIFLDDPNGRNWPAPVLDAYINDAQRALWGALADEDESFGLREATAITVDGQARYPFPVDILGRRIRKLFILSATTGRWGEVPRKPIEDVAREDTGRASTPRMYCVMDGYFRLSPPPDSTSGKMRLLYTRQPSRLRKCCDRADSDSEFAEIIACDAAIRAIRTKGGDTTHLVSQRAELLVEAQRSVTSDDLIAVSPSWIY